MQSRSHRRRELAAHIRTERARLVGSKAAAFKAAGVARATWDRVEMGGDVTDYTYARAEKLLGWPAGSIQRYLDGEGDLPQAAPAAVEDSPQGLMRTEQVPGLPREIVALFATMGASTPLEKVEVLQDLTRAVLAESIPQQR